RNIRLVERPTGECAKRIALQGGKIAEITPGIVVGGSDVLIGGEGTHSRDDLRVVGEHAARERLLFFAAGVRISDPGEAEVNVVRHEETTNGAPVAREEGAARHWRGGRSAIPGP